MDLWAGLAILSGSDMVVLHVPSSSEGNGENIVWSRGAYSPPPILNTWGKGVPSCHLLQLSPSKKVIAKFVTTIASIADKIRICR